MLLIAELFFVFLKGTQTDRLFYRRCNGTTNEKIEIQFSIKTNTMNKGKVNVRTWTLTTDVGVMVTLIFFWTLLWIMSDDLNILMHPDYLYLEMKPDWNIMGAES